MQAFLQTLKRLKTDGEKVAFIKSHFGLTSGDFAQRVGVSQPFISKVLNGQKSFSRDTLIKISQEFQIPIQYWIEGYEPPSAVTDDPILQKELEENFEWIKLAKEQKLDPDTIKKLIEVAKLLQK